MVLFPVRERATMCDARVPEQANLDCIQSQEQRADLLAESGWFGQ